MARGCGEMKGGRENYSSEVSRGSEAEAVIAKEKATADSNHGEDSKNRSELNEYIEDCDQTVKFKV